MYVMRTKCYKKYTSEYLDPFHLFCANNIHNDSVFEEPILILFKLLMYHFSS